MAARFGLTPSTQCGRGGKRLLRGDVGGVAMEPAPEGGDAHQDAFEESDCNEGAEYATADIEYIMMGCVDSRKPDTKCHYSQNTFPSATTMNDERVDESYERIG